MKREYFCYGISSRGEVTFVRDINQNVQLFDEDRANREARIMDAMTQKIGHSPREADTHICYWTKRDGSVEFARNINKDVQLFSEEDATASVSIHGCMSAKVGFIGIDKSGTPTA